MRANVAVADINGSRDTFILCVLSGPRDEIYDCLLGFIGPKEKLVKIISRCRDNAHRSA